MTTAKRGKTATAREKRFEARDVKRVDGWETSDGKVHDHPVKAAAVQAELDLFRIVFHYIDVEEAMDGSEEDAKRAVRELFRTYRDELARLSRAAYMTPDEIGEAMDRHARPDLSKEQAPPIAPEPEARAKAILLHAFDKGWERRGDWENNDHAPDRSVAFDKYWMMRTSEELRYLLPPTTQLFTEFNAHFAFDAGFSAACEQSGGSASTMFKKWWKEAQPVRDAHTSIHADDDDAAFGLRRPQAGKTLEEQFQALPALGRLPAPVRQRIEDEAIKAFKSWRKDHPTQTPHNIGEWNDQHQSVRDRFIEEVRRRLMI